MTGLSLGHPFSLVDSGRLLSIHDWNRNETSYFLQWERSFEKIQAYLSVFSNPGQPPTTAFASGSHGASGNGFQIMLVHDH